MGPCNENFARPYGNLKILAEFIVGQLNNPKRSFRNWSDSIFDIIVIQELI